MFLCNQNSKIKAGDEDEAKIKKTQQCCRIALQSQKKNARELKVETLWSYVGREKIQTDRQRHGPTEKSSSWLATRFIGHSLRCLRVIRPACREVHAKREEGTRMRRKHTEISSLITLKHHKQVFYVNYLVNLNICGLVLVERLLRATVRTLLCCWWSPCPGWAYVLVPSPCSPA